jgi:hypothetical protein
MNRQIDPDQRFLCPRLSAVSSLQRFTKNFSTTSPQSPRWQRRMFAAWPIPTMLHWKLSHDILAVSVVAPAERFAAWLQIDIENRKSADGRG